MSEVEITDSLPTASWPRILELDFPLERHAEKDREAITQLRFRKPIARDLRTQDDPRLGDHGKTIALISRLTGLKSETIDMLDWNDYAKAAEHLEDFMVEAGMIVRAAPPTPPAPSDS